MRCEMDAARLAGVSADNEKVMGPDEVVVFPNLLLRVNAFNTIVKINGNVALFYIHCTMELIQLE